MKSIFENGKISPVQVSNSVDDRSGQPEETTIERGNSLNSEIPEWLQEFRENLVDDEIHYREALTPVLLMKRL